MILPIFPLQSVLLPGMPLALRLFEPRYLTMFRHLLETNGEFGVVLIERGPEVGGGDRRFSRGTVARIAQYQVVDEMIALVAAGGARFEVEKWFDDDPYPQALVRWLPALEWSEELAPARARTEKAVRRALAAASEYATTLWPANVELDDDPVVSAWQLAGIAPIGPLDHFTLLGSSSLDELLSRTAALADDAAETLALTANSGLAFETPDEQDEQSARDPGGNGGRGNMPGDGAGTADTGTDEGGGGNPDDETGQEDTKA